MAHMESRPDFEIAGCGGMFGLAIAFCIASGEYAYGASTPRVDATLFSLFEHIV